MSTDGWALRQSGLAVLALLLVIATSCAPAPAGGGPAAKPGSVSAATSESAPTAVPAAALAPPAPSAPAARTKVRIGGQPVSASSGLFIALDKGFFDEQSLEIEWINFASTSELIPSLATDQLEVSTGAANVAFLNAVARGTGVKCVGNASSMPLGWGFAALVVRKELVDSGRFRQLSDLRGLSVGMTPPLYTTGIAVDLDRILTRAGLTDADVDQRPLSFPDMAPAIASGALDTALMTEPLIAATVRAGTGLRFLGLDEVNPGRQLVCLNYGPAFMSDQPDAARRFAVAFLRGQRYNHEAFGLGRNQDEVIEILTRHTNVKDPGLYREMAPTGTDPDGLVHRPSIEADQEFFLRKGTLPAPVPLPPVGPEELLTEPRIPGVGSKPTPGIEHSL